MLDNYSQQKSDEHFEDDYKKFYDLLTNDEYDAIGTYTGYKYEDINDYLREGKMGTGEDEEIEEIVRNAEAGISKYKLTENLVVSRKSTDDIFRSLISEAFPNGVRLESTYHSDIDSFVNTINKFAGSLVHDKAFTSSSTSRHIWHGSVWFEIKLPKGTNCAYVNPMSHNKGEMEVLINRGARYRVVSARAGSTKDGYRPIVTLELVDFKAK